MKNKFEVNLAENIETKKTAFHFPEIVALKEGMVKLVQKLQTNIDEGKYNALVSDEVGGRIPTLVLKEIIKARKPDTKIDTYFIASGKTYFPKHGSKDYYKLVEYLRGKIKNDKNVLLVTQYAHSGWTLFKLENALQEAGVSHIDVAVLNSLNNEDYLKRFLLEDGSVFVGTQDSSTYKFNERANWFTGVAKTKEYSPTLKRLQEVIAEEGREQFISQEEWQSIFDIKQGEAYQSTAAKSKDPEKLARWEARSREPLSDAELEELRDTIRKTRDDVKILSQEVLSAVWQAK